MLGLEPHLEGKTHVIWDWNGTLIDDSRLCFEIMVELVELHSLSPLTEEAHRALFRMPVRDFYQEMGFDFSRTPFEMLVVEFATRYEARMLNCSLYEGAATLLRKLHEKPTTQAILSAANEAQLKNLVKHFGIDGFFEMVFGRSDHEAHSKIERGVELLREWDVERERVILVGDMDHDWEVANALGIECLLLGDGHQSYERLAALSPKALRSRFL